MECYKCKKPMSEEKRGMIPVDAKGTPGRRWVCLDCADIIQKRTVPKDVRDLCNQINPDSHF